MIGLQKIGVLSKPSITFFLKSGRRHSVEERNRYGYLVASGKKPAAHYVLHCSAMNKNVIGKAGRF
jgi:hypothetical protein